MSYEQRQRQDAVYPHVGGAGTEPGPSWVVAEGAGTHGAAGRGGADAGALADAVLHVVDVPDKGCALHDGVRPVRFEQGQPGSVRPGDGLHREARDVGQQDFQAESCRAQMGQPGQALGEILGFCITEGGRGMFIGIGTVPMMECGFVRLLGIHS